MNMAIILRYIGEICSAFKIQLPRYGTVFVMES